MERLFLIIYQYRAFFTFLLLEVFCFWLVVENNQYQGTKFFNSSNSVVATLNNFSQSIRDYFLLSEVNSTLAEENARLRQELEQYNQRFQNLDTTLYKNPEVVTRFEFESAKVVNNQVDRFKNFITINKGADAGLAPGMAVISPLGVVGKVKTVSKHYGVVTSILNIDVMVSALLKRTNHYGSIQWDGKDPDHVKFRYIPRHVKPVVGDSVITSGYNTIFPQGIMVGTIEHVDISNEALFYDITVSLSQDFRQLSFVTIIKSKLKHEQDSLEETVKILER